MAKENVEKIAETSLLFDFYGVLLTERQREVMELYHEENLSLIEIAEEIGISKQAVHDNLKRTEKILRNYETKLGLVESLMKSRKAISEIDQKIDGLIEREHDTVMKKEFEEIKRIINSLED